VITNSLANVVSNNQKTRKALQQDTNNKNRTERSAKQQQKTQNNSNKPRNEHNIPSF